MKALLTLISVVFLFYIGRCEEAETFATNFSRPLEMLPKVLLPNKFPPPFTPTSLPRGSLTMSASKISVKPLQALESGKIEKVPPTPSTYEVSLRLVPLEKPVMPSLYWIHFEARRSYEPEITDLFGKRWKITPKTELLFPLCKWENPSAVGERFTWLVGLSHSFR